MSTQHNAELHHYLQAERARIEFWRQAPPLRSPEELKADFLPKPFTSREPAPIQPSRQAISRICWNRLYKDSAERHPPNIPLFVISGIGALVVALVTTLLVAQVNHVVIACFWGFVAAVLVGGAGFALILFVKHKEVTSKVEAIFDDEFAFDWAEAEQNYARLVGEYQATEREAKERWHEQEQARISALTQSCTNAQSVKSRIETIIEALPHVVLDFQTCANNEVSIVLRIPTLDEVVNKKSKKLSEKTGKVISKSKTREEREADYAVWVAGTCLAEIVDILNISPFCVRLRIALFSQLSSRKAFHAAGQIERRELPQFSWATVDPQNTLRNLGFRIEPSKTKNLTSKPDWVDRLERVQIEIGTPPR